VLHQRLKSQGTPCLTVCSKYPNLSELTSLRHNFREQGVQTIYGNDSQAINWLGLIGFGMKGVSKIGVKHTVFPIKSALKYNWFLDKILCVSEASRTVCIQGGIRPEATETIYGGLDIPAYDRAHERSVLAKSLGLHKDTRLYCAVGSLVNCKGFDTVIESASILLREGRKFVIAICGEGPLRENLQTQINRKGLNGVVRLVGFQQEPYRWIAAADSLLHPSRSEGLSLVTIAAQLLGTPVIATAIGGLNEVMHSPATQDALGWVIQKDSPADLARAIVDLEESHEKTSRFVIEAKLWANRRFLAKQMIEGVLGLAKASAKTTAPRVLAFPSYQLGVEIVSLNAAKDAFRGRSESRL